jgi:hypothetical protein
VTRNGLLAALKTKIIAATWSGGSVIFASGSVAITNAMDKEQAFKLFRVPFCLIQYGRFERDPEKGEDTNLLIGTVKTIIGNCVPGDGIGENTFMGANKTGGSTASEGRGLTEIEEPLFDAIGLLNTNDSLTIQFSNAAAGGGELMDGMYRAWQEHDWEAVCTMT